MQWPHVRLNPDSNPAANGMEGFYTWELAEEFRQSWRPPRPDERYMPNTTGAAPAAQSTSNLSFSSALDTCGTGW